MTLKNCQFFSCSESRSLPTYTHCSNWPQSISGTWPILSASALSYKKQRLSWITNTLNITKWPTEEAVKHLCLDFAAWVTSNIVWSSQGRCLYVSWTVWTVLDILHHIKCVEVRGRLWMFVLTFYLFEAGGIVAAYTSYLTCLPPFRDFPVSASNLTIQAQGLQMYVAIHNFYIGSGDSNSRLYSKNYFSGLVDSGYERLPHCLPATHGDTTGLPCVPSSKFGRLYSQSSAPLLALSKHASG